MGPSTFCTINIQCYCILFDIQHTFIEDQPYDWYWETKMNDLGEISLVRKANTEQKAVIKHDKNCESIGTKGTSFC